MTEIKVIVDAPVYDLGALSGEERDLLFERIGEENPWIPRAQLDGFNEMQTQILKDTAVKIRPDLPELLARKLVHLSERVVPVIKLHQPTEMRVGSGETLSLRVRFDSRVAAETTTGLKYVIPIGEEAEIIGLKIKPSIVVPISALISSGFYNYIQCSRSEEDIFLGAKRPPLPERISDEKSMQELFDQLITAEEINTESFPYIFAQIRDALTNAKSEVPNLRKALEFESNPIYTWPKEQSRDKILDFLETVHKGKLQNVYDTALLADITLRGLAPIYYRAILKGQDSKEVKNAVSILNERSIRIKFQADVKRKKFAEMVKLGVYRIIIEKKLGAKRLAEIDKRAYSAENLLAALKPQERKPIELEYDRREKYLQAVVDNKCPHVKLYRAFRSARSSDIAAKNYNELKKYFDPVAKGDSMVTCRNCKFDILCPHVRDFAEMEAAGKSMSEIKSKLTKYTQAAVKEQFFCNICGEIISSLEAFESIADTAKQVIDEELGNFIWGEVASLMKYLKFGSLVNVSSFISSIRDTIYPYIFDIEKQILKSKTNSADEIKAKRRLYITIYAFAYLTHLILSNRGKDIDFKDLASKKASAVDVIKHIMQIIILSRNVIIREIPGMTPDIIKNVLIKSYKTIQSAGTQIITYSGETEDLLSTLLIDPIYRYIYYANVVGEVLSGKEVPSDPFDSVDMLNEYLGDTVQKLEKAENVFAKAKMPKINTKDFLALEYKNTNQALAIYNKAHAGYIGNSFELFMEKIHGKLYNEPMYMSVTEITDAKFRPIFEKYFAKCTAAAELERALNHYRDVRAAHSYQFIKADQTRQWVDPNAKLGRIYDEDGNLHVFNILICKDVGSGGVSGTKTKGKDKTNDTSETYELTAKEIAKATESGDVFNKIIIDKKCSVCKILKSEASALSEEKIRESLRARKTVDNFFKFYENRCPLEGLHEIKDGACSKCGLNISYFSNTSSKDAISYYIKYQKNYLTKPEAIAVEPPKTIEPLDYPEYHSYAFNFNTVTRLTDKLKINHRLIVALGSVEKRDYSDVNSGKYIPIEVEERYDTRIFVLDTAVKNLITEYNQLRFYYHLIKPPTGLQPVLENVNKSLVQELANILPDIYDDYNNKFQYMQRVKKPREIVSFCIQILCEKCLKILEDEKQSTAKLRHAFVEYFIKKLLRADELVSKPGQFNWSVLYGDKGEKPAADSNFNDDDEGEEDVPEGDVDTAPLSMDDFDVDREPEDINPDEDDQGIKVGEDLGLS